MTGSAVMGSFPGSPQRAAPMGAKSNQSVTHWCFFPPRCFFADFKRKLSPFISKMVALWVMRSSMATANLSVWKT